MSIPVITVGQAQEAVVGGLERLHGPVTVVRRCSELAELMAACQSGLALAAVVAAIDSKIIGPDERVLVMITGSGLKDTKNAIRAGGKPIPVEPSVAAVQAALK